MSANVLTPAAVLVLWSLVMLFWMAGARLPNARKLGVDISKAVGGRGSDLDPMLPPQAAWKSHNYAHLMEQPTIFTPPSRSWRSPAQAVMASMSRSPGATP